MKNLLLLLTTAITFSASAQITLENTYNGTNGIDAVEFSSHGTKYVSDESTSSTAIIKVYNADHSLFKTITYAAPTGHTYVSNYCISDRLFNTTDDIDVVVCFKNSAISSYKSFIITESGTELADLGNTYIARVRKVDGSYKLLTHTYSATQNRVYSLPGTMPAGLTKTNPTTTIQEGTTMAMPNPAGDNITITYDLPSGTAGAQLTIYSADGRAIHTENLSKNSQSVMVSLPNNATGLYHYTISATGLTPISNNFVITH